MKALLRSASIAPKKANVVARIVRGMSVPEAQDFLRRTDKKAARLLEGLLASAVANAAHNDRQDPQFLIVQEVIVNQGSAYRRGIPMARGRARPIAKFLSHISLVLGVREEGEGDGREQEQRRHRKKGRIPSASSVSPVPSPS